LGNQDFGGRFASRLKSQGGRGRGVNQSLVSLQNVQSKEKSSKGMNARRTGTERKPCSSTSLHTWRLSKTSLRGLDEREKPTTREEGKRENLRRISNCQRRESRIRGGGGSMEPRETSIRKYRKTELTDLEYSTIKRKRPRCRK